MSTHWSDKQERAIAYEVRKRFTCWFVTAMSCIVLLCCIALSYPFAGKASATTHGVQTCWVERNQAMPTEGEYICGTIKQSHNQWFVRYVDVSPSSLYPHCQEDEILRPSQYRHDNAVYVCQNAEEYVQQNTSLLFHH